MTDPIHQRREILKPHAVPAKGHEYVVTLTREVQLKKVLPCSVTLHIRYIPEKMTIPQEALREYFAALEKEEITSMEQAAEIVVSDIYNELVPFMVEVELHASYDGTTLQVLRHERQPNWDNPALLARLKHF